MSTGRKFNFSLIKHVQSKVSFLITDCPANEDLEEYAELLVSHEVSVLFRLCDASSYDSTVVKSKGIEVVDECAFEDGDFHFNFSL